MKSLATNGRISSPESTETLSRASVANIADILGLGGLLQCSEIYSKKVFVGGLPPDADEGNGNNTIDCDTVRFLLIR